MTTSKFSAYSTYIDSVVLPGSPHLPAQNWEFTVLKKHFLITERELHYRFSTHFHPFINEMTTRLIEQSVPGFQKLDTEYATPVILGEATKVAFFDETEEYLDLAKGESVILKDGAKVKGYDGLVGYFSAHRIETEQREPVEPESNDGIYTLLATTRVTTSSGKSGQIKTDTKIKMTRKRPGLALFNEDFWKLNYKPVDPLAADAMKGVGVEMPSPVKELDFSTGGSYSIYNWELFFHVPFTIAIHLSKNQRFQEAQHWFHYIFDPTDDSMGRTPERFWKVKPFKTADVKRIEELLVNLSTVADEDLYKETIRSIVEWKDRPFRPHVLAGHRQWSYMIKTVMAYLDNLIAWGDSLFRQDTLETINEATQLYVVAANILGTRPQAVPKKASVRPQTYHNLKQDLDKFGNVMREIETEIPFDLNALPDEESNDEKLVLIKSLGKALYFCVPRNEKLLGYWDTVADRLFKIHNSLNIQGVFRELPLFEPPIDPAMLARATAAGLDVGAVISGSNQPLPLVRFQLLLQKATEITQEVKSLGSQLLSVMEKQDNEVLSILRAKHETVILKLTEAVRYGQWQESIKSREGMEKSLVNVFQRYKFYEMLLGTDEAEITFPEYEGIDIDSLFNEKKFEQTEPVIETRAVDTDIFAGDIGIDIAGMNLNTYEAVALSMQTLGALPLEVVAMVLQAIGATVRTIPKTAIVATPVGVGVKVEIGGEDIGGALSMWSKLTSETAGILNHMAQISSQVGGYVRREQDWILQRNMAAGEINLVYKQLRASEIREAIAEKEWQNHKQQIEHAEEIEQFLTDEKKGKKASHALYTWMKRETKGLYGQCFQFAFDIAKKAERALQHELGDADLNFIQYGYLAGKEGLLAGEKLYLDLKRMEMSYHDLNQREYEVTKNIGLKEVAPLALITLRATGSASFELNEELFDRDCPGHYFRRIKTVALSIPCISGPYTSVNCTLRLLNSHIRKSAQIGDLGYSRNGSEDTRFDDYYGATHSIVTSTAQGDSGMFETNLHDEKYLPFENSGVISQWSLQLPEKFRQFDYNTISDVILTIRYTAREGGAALRLAAEINIDEKIKEAAAGGMVRIFSVRHEFPTEWGKFQSELQDNNIEYPALSLNLTEDHYPYWAKGHVSSVANTELIVQSDKGSIKIFTEVNGGNDKSDELIEDGSLDNLLRNKSLKNVKVSTPVGKWEVYFEKDQTISNIWVLVTWQDTAS